MSSSPDPEREPKPEYWPSETIEDYEERLAEWRRVIEEDDSE